MPNKYHPALRIMHWAMAVLLTVQIFLGWYMEYSEDAMGKDSPEHLALYNLHKSFGVTLLILVAIRIIIRVISFVPPLPATLRPLIRNTAKISHYIMYVLMMVTPLIGYAMSDMVGKGVKLFGLPLPKLFPDNMALGKTMGGLHEFLGYTLLVLIIVHVSAVVWHRFFDRPDNNVLPRII